MRIAWRSVTGLGRTPALQGADHRQHDDDLDQADEQPAGRVERVLEQVAVTQVEDDRLNDAFEQRLLRLSEQIGEPVHHAVGPPENRCIAASAWKHVHTPTPQRLSASFGPGAPAPPPDAALPAVDVAFRATASCGLRIHATYSG